MSDEADPGEDARADAVARATSLRKLIGLSGGIFLLIALGVLVGAVLWPRVVTVEKKVVAPIRQVATRAGPAERLPDLVEASCPALVLIEPPATPAPPPPVHTRHGRHHGRAHAPAGPPPPVDGFLISDDGYLVTAATAIGDADSVSVDTGDGQTISAKLVRQDPVSGIALLKVDAHDLTALPFADDDFPRIGTWGFALASPHGSGCRASVGIVGSDFVTEQAASGVSLRVSPTMPEMAVGSPFLAADGRVMGMWVKAPTAADPGLLLSGRLISRITSGWMRGGGAPAGADLGMLVDDLTPALAHRLDIDGGRGAVVVMIQAGSPAAKAGLQVGDVILAIGQSPISSAAELARTLDPTAASTLQISRDGNTKTITIAAP